ncbi:MULTISPECIES: cupin domain-containing protein [unclassified Chelatococcus]|uniref:cupin domain-containing protein n=1 Tax=unclassified Chelatococcus TaxID=2638111 RepID=UPI0020C0BB94|nr:MULTISPECIES: cupin domain-containing protein [unclassified Chelatococcus]
MIEMVSPKNCKSVWVAGDRIRFLGTVPETQLELIEVEIPAGSGTPPHLHESPELFFIVAGELTVRQFRMTGAPDVIRAEQGATILIPSRVPHNYTNESGSTVRMLAVLKSSMTAFFREIAAVEPVQGEPDFGMIGAAMLRHGVEIFQTSA